MGMTPENVQTFLEKKFEIKKKFNFFKMLLL